MPDPEMGYALHPRQHAFTHDQLVEINSIGLRDRDYPREPGSGTRRFLALGDSQTFGNGLALADTWPKQLEHQLERREHSAWEVVNAGLPGAATWQEEILLRRTCEAYSVEGFAVGFYVNDVVPIGAGPDSSASNLTNTWSKRVLYSLKRSALFVASWNARYSIAAWLSGERTSWEEKILTGDADPVIESGWDQVEQSLAKMKRFADEHSLRFWLVALPRRDQVAGTQPGRAHQRRIAEISAKLGIRPGETDPTGTFTLMEVECLGACDRAPVLMINDEGWQERLRPEDVGKFLDDLKARGYGALTGCHLHVEK